MNTRGAVFHEMTNRSIDHFMGTHLGQPVTILNPVVFFLWSPFGSEEVDEAPRNLGLEH